MNVFLCEVSNLRPRFEEIWVRLKFTETYIQSCQNLNAEEKLANLESDIRSKSSEISSVLVEEGIEKEFEVTVIRVHGIFPRIGYFRFAAEMLKKGELADKGAQKNYPPTKLKLVLFFFVQQIEFFIHHVFFLIDKSCSPKDLVGNVRPENWSVRKNCSLVAREFYK